MVYLPTIRIQIYKERRKCFWPSKNNETISLDVFSVCVTKGMMVVNVVIFLVHLSIERK